MEQGVHADVDEMRYLTKELANARELLHDMRNNMSHISLQAGHFGAIPQFSGEAADCVALLEQVTQYLDNASHVVTDYSRYLGISASLLEEADAAGSALLKKMTIDD